MHLPEVAMLRFFSWMILIAGGAWVVYQIYLSWTDEWTMVAMLVFTIILGVLIARNRIQARLRRKDERVERARGEWSEPAGKLMPPGYMQPRTRAQSPIIVVAGQNGWNGGGGMGYGPPMEPPPPQYRDLPDSQYETLH